MAAQHDEAARYAPQDAPPDVAAPDLLNFREVRGSTDKALADGFFRHYRHLFTNGDGNLYVYHKDRGAWSRDDVQSQILTYASHLSDRFHDELAGVREERARLEAAGQGDAALALAERMNQLVKLIVHCESGKTMATVARFLQAKLKTIMADQPLPMNPGRDMLACANGLVNLRDGTLRHPKPEDRITRNTYVRYRFDADFDWWSNVILDMCGGNTRLAEFLQVWAGYTASGYTNEHCMAIMWGKGRNGKNLLMDALAAALGGYASALPQSFIEGTGNQATMDNNMLFAMAQLDGVRMAYISETGERGKLKESWVKSQTGDHTIRARLARENYYEFTVTHKLTVGTNHKPEITGTDDGVWERIRMIPMRVMFGTEAQVENGIAQRLADRTLLDKATSPEGREAILRWAVEGARKYFAHGLRRYTPPEVLAETLVYRREQDVLGQFLQSVSVHIPRAEVERIKVLEGGGANAKTFAKLEMDDRLRVERLELWRTFCVWAEENGHRPMSSTTFARRITGTQRFWQDDVGEELLMPALEVCRSSGGAVQFYRYIRLSETGIRYRNVARSREIKPVTDGDHHDM